MSYVCPCGSKITYAECCEMLHRQQLTASSPLQLMKSRYCAFVKHQFDYLIQTHHHDFLNGLTADILAQGSPQWLGLQIMSHTESQNAGTVTFQAWYKEGNKIDAIHECSNFLKVDHTWFYTDGTQLQAKLPKRNEPCVCHSGKKFKACCLK
ncbi:YchJ family protein [Shewanella maritima]|uniref:YchJ family protein n=1 Tax=Shewanella maritima TaxID=2520507 RepID=UPI003735C6E6